MSRPVRSHRAVLSVPLVFLLIVSSAACGSDSPDTSRAVPLSSVDATADVDVDAGTIVLPAERFQLTPSEQVEVDRAVQQVFDGCVRDRGFDVVSDLPEADVEGDRRYGTWLVQEAEVYGFVPPSVGQRYGAAADDTTTWPGGDGALEFPPGDVRNADLDVILECRETPEVLSLTTYAIEPAFDYGAEIGSLRGEALGSSEGQQVFSDWEACLESHGLERDEERSPYSIRGATMDVTERNIAMALVDVGCKTEVDFVQRLADLEAALQAPVVARYFEELTAMRADYDAVLAEVRRLDAGDPAS